MREITITKNDSNQRLDRFMNKYLPKASKSIIQKYIRTKKIKVNKKRAQPSDMIFEGDIINIYIYDEVLSKYEDKRVYKAIDYNLDIVYEDENIAIINKQAGILAHAASKEDYGKNIVDYFVQYLIDKKEFVPRIEKTFTPALANRLDRNTSGLLIGCKNQKTLRLLNEYFQNRNLSKYYSTICVGNIKNQTIDIALEKDEEKNKVYARETGKKSKTKINKVKGNRDFSLVNIELITGRTHQIRAHLAQIGHPIIGDIKYGDRRINDEMRREFGLNSQLLHSKKIKFNDMEGHLSYLSNKEFEVKEPELFKKIENKLLI